MLVILSGVSGSGKDTIKEKLIKNNPNIITFPSITTREIRVNEIPGDKYIYVSKDEFMHMINNNELYEYSMHHNNYYGTSKKIFTDALKNNKILLKDIDVNGTVELKKVLKDEQKIISIFLNIDKSVMIDRLKKRGDLKDEEDLNKRVERYDYEILFLDQYDYVINNIDIDKTLSKIEEIIQNNK